MYWIKAEDEVTRLRAILVARATSTRQDRMAKLRSVRESIEKKVPAPMRMAPLEWEPDAIEDTCIFNY